MRQIGFAVAIGVVALSADARDISPVAQIASSVATNLLPPLPQTTSPVAFFRQLLVMNPAERSRALASRSPAARDRVMAKVREYLALDPNERELRLRATELRWYLTPMLHQPPEARADSMAQVPADLRGLIESRLQQWDLLPPPAQSLLLENEKALQYFAQVHTNNPVALSEEQKQLSEQFNQFFEFTAREKQKTLSTLSEPERVAMEKTLKTFDALPPKQRALCVRNYAKFAGMSTTERAEFLKSADQWAKMSPAERQSWRTLVSQIPQLPPLPPPVIPASLMPPGATKTIRPSVATN